MIKIEKVDIYGFEAAIRGMRNPKNSWDRSDSIYNCEIGKCKCSIGTNDLKLMKQLAAAGSEHRKYLRYINVTVDITAPLYWWKEFDAYRIGTVSDSCSTMHKIHEKEFKLSDFSSEHLTMWSKYGLNKTIKMLNEYRKRFNESHDKKDWWQLIQLLPTSYNQKRTIQLNYEVLSSMYKQRKGHKLSEWNAFCAWTERLPYAKELITGQNNEFTKKVDNKEK